MNELRKKILRQVTVAGLLGAASLFNCSCSKGTSKKNEAARSASAAKQIDPKIDKMIAAAYDLKQEGKNGEALRDLKKVGAMLAKSPGKKSEAYASNLDDRATCYLRGGDYTKATQLYNEADAILKELELTNTRLYAGIHRRLRTIDAFKKNNIVCSESMEAVSSTPTGSDTEKALPYFPKSEDLYTVFYNMNQEIKGCVPKMSKSIPIWNIVTGDGHVLMSSVKSNAVTREQARCIEKMIAQSAVEHRSEMPRFRACFRNYTYPLLFR